MLEYSQRLAAGAQRYRGAWFIDRSEAFGSSLEGGSIALSATAKIDIGASADVVALDMSDVPYIASQQVLDQWIFASGVRVGSVWVRGKELVQSGRHIRREAITRRFHKVMADLVNS